MPPLEHALMAIGGVTAGCAFFNALQGWSVGWTIVLAVLAVFDILYGVFLAVIGGGR